MGTPSDLDLKTAENYLRFMENTYQTDPSFQKALSQNISEAGVANTTELRAEIFKKDLQSVYLNHLLKKPEILSDAKTEALYQQKFNAISQATPPANEETRRAAKAIYGQKVSTNPNYTFSHLMDRLASSEQTDPASLRVGTDLTTKVLNNLATDLNASETIDATTKQSPLRMVKAQLFGLNAWCQKRFSFGAHAPQEKTRPIPNPNQKIGRA